MSYQEVYGTVSAVLPCAHMAWREGQAPQLPWAVYYLDDQSGFNADNTTYVGKHRWCVELYQKAMDLELQEELEAAILAAFSPFEKYESWVESENCLMTTYYFTELKG